MIKIKQLTVSLILQIHMSTFTHVSHGLFRRRRSIFMDSKGPSRRTVARNRCNLSFWPGDPLMPVRF
jgi:hypothetical protein